MLKFTEEPVSSLRYKLACAYSEDSNQSEQSDQSHSFPPEETLDPWLPIERISKTLDQTADAQADLSLCQVKLLLETGSKNKYDKSSRKSNTNCQEKCIAK